MAIETKPDKSTKAEKLPPLQFRNNPEVKKRIDEYKAANPDDVTYYTRLVKEHPERAIDAMFYKDMQRHENEMRLVNKQLPQARAFYNAQAPEAKARIDADLQGVEPFYRDKAFVSAALREKDRQARREFATSAPSTTPPAPGTEGGKVVPMPDQPAAGAPPKMAM